MDITFLQIENGSDTELLFFKKEIISYLANKKFSTKSITLVKTLKMLDRELNKRKNGKICRQDSCSLHLNGKTSSSSPLLLMSSNKTPLEIPGFMQDKTLFTMKNEDSEDIEKDFDCSSEDNSKTFLGRKRLSLCQFGSEKISDDISSRSSKSYSSNSFSGFSGYELPSKSFEENESMLSSTESIFNNKKNYLKNNPISPCIVEFNNFIGNLYGSSSEFESPEISLGLKENIQSNKIFTESLFILNDDTPEYEETVREKSLWPKN